MPHHRHRPNPPYGSWEAAVYLLTRSVSWAVGTVFFGACVISIGILVLVMLAPETTAIPDLLVVPATIGEFAILFLMLIRGVPKGVSTELDINPVAGGR